MNKQTMNTIHPYDIEHERNQLLSQWRCVAQKLHDSFAYKQIMSLVNNSDSDQGSRYIRQIHDKFGFKAKGDLSNGGLCSGALYRTKKFIQTHNRNGSKGEHKTVHIEHTIPVIILAKTLNATGINHSSALKWLIKNSVVTAMNEHEPNLYLATRHKTSNVFEKSSSEYGLPFMRYVKLFEDPDNHVVDVWRREVINPLQFTTTHNLNNICELLTAVDAPASFIEMLQAH